MASEYRDWITYASGSSTRLSRLRLYIKDLQAAVEKGSYTVEGRSWSSAEIRQHLALLLEAEKAEAAAADTAAGDRVFFTRGMGRSL